MQEMMFIQAADYKIHPLRRIFEKPKLRQSRYEESVYAFGVGTHVYSTRVYKQPKVVQARHDQPSNNPVTLHEIVSDANIRFSGVASPPAYEIGHANGLDNSLRCKTPQEHRVTK